MLAHSQGTFRRVVAFRIDTTAPAVGLSGVPQKTTKLRYVSYGTICLFLAAQTRKKQKYTKTPRHAAVLARTAATLLLMIGRQLWDRKTEDKTGFCLKRTETRE